MEPQGALSGRRGWWGDLFPTLPNDRIGSRLWLLSREKQTELTRTRAQQYATDALQWMLEDGVAARVEVTAEWVRMGVLGLRVEVTRPQDTSETFRFASAWDELLGLRPLTKAEIDELTPPDELATEDGDGLVTEDGVPLVA